ncbi:GntR family transcriptional regulator [Mycolicibacterium bacteremicum]|uniref:GntR family transcriptional regulator n=1 Tax=Mycolicibacterium bacteremicum TaxID=564198 RepID=A0A1W9YNC2_MYCBA|nr:GntR family transcriptional regulator [Mycolicibacterium bacteremicum]MCV7430175.1 GntR family transcriptional regulator [Mycolicibacterium bacteremicum]ORA01536.1 GntR family transcriptional regulator [Mycolicibacterium bacteremicum]
MQRSVDEPVSLRDRVYVDLGKRLMVGEIDHRTRLVESQLCETLNVSRTPLREALVRLHADGMLERRPDGYYPVALDIAGVRDLYELRITIELQGITRILDTDELRYDKDRLARLAAQWRELEAHPPPAEADMVLLDESFHLELSAASGNAAMVATLDNINRRIRLIRMYDFVTAERVTATITEHLGIVDLLLDDQLDAGRKALHEHVGASFEVVERRAIRALSARALGQSVTSFEDLWR